MLSRKRHRLAHLGSQRLAWAQSYPSAAPLEKAAGGADANGSATAAPCWSVGASSSGGRKVRFFRNGRLIAERLSILGQDARGFARGAFEGWQLDQEPRAAIKVVRLGGRKRDRAAVAHHQISRDREAETRADRAR